MKYIYEFIWAALCAWMCVWLLGSLDTKFGILQYCFIPNIIEFVHGFGVSAKTILFLAIFLVFWASGIHKIVGRILIIFIGWIVIIILVGLGLMCAYAFLSWLAGSL